MRIYELLLLVACSGVGIALYAVAYRSYPYSTGSAMLWRAGPSLDEPNYQLMVSVALGCLVPTLLAIDLYRLSRTLVRGFWSGAVVLASGDLIGILALLNLGLFLYDSTLPINRWDFIRGMPAFMGPASLGVMAVYATTRMAADAPALTFRGTAPYWIAIRLAQIIVRRYL